MMESNEVLAASKTPSQGEAIPVPRLRGEVLHDASLWQALAEAPDAAGYAQSWLAIQCGWLPEVRAGMVVLRKPTGAFGPVATWPESGETATALLTTAQQTVKTRQGVLSRLPVTEGPEPAGYSAIGYPVHGRGGIQGAAVFAVDPIDDARAQAILRQIHWGVGALENFLGRDGQAEEQATRERFQLVLDLIATAVGQERFAAAAMALVTDMASRLACDRVSLGVLVRGHARVVAVSHSAEFKARSNVLRAVAEAMEECVDQREVIVYPSATPESAAIVRAHAQLASAHGDKALLSIPLEAGGLPVGVLLLERPADRGFEPAVVALGRSLGGLLGPLVDRHRREDRWIGATLWDAGVRHLTELVGPGHVGLKVATGSLAALLLVGMVARADYRVTAKTVLEPIVQRAVAAPFDGYIREAPVRAGQVVRANEVLATLDDRDLTLERLKAASKLEEYTKEFHKAMTARDAATVEIVSAQLAQVRSDLALLDEQLSHTRVLAPFDGIVVSGDLTQQLGSPVERGKVLFEVAPLDRYRVVLEVDEREIADVQVGQRGQVLFAAFPMAPMGLTIAQLTPVSTAKEGRNFFRVEAALDQPNARLRPAMEGAGKIAIDRRRLVWIWTHDLLDWLRLTLWSWWP